MIQIITPSDAVIIECKFGIESALSIFTITCISAPQPARTRKKLSSTLTKLDYHTMLKKKNDEHINIDITL